MSDQKKLIDSENKETMQESFFVEEDVTLEDVCEFMMRGKHPEYVDESDIRVLNQNAIRWNELREENLKNHDPDVDMFENRFIRSGDIVINSTGVGTLGRCYYFRESPRKMFADSHVTILRTDDRRLDSEYLYYILSSPEYQQKIQQIATGSTGQIELNKRDLQSIEVSFPNKKVQNHITSTLSNFDQKINSNRRINRLMEDIGQTLFKSWFVDFEPYDNLKNSDIGEIPEQFEIKMISEFAHIILGNSPKSEYYNEAKKGLPFFQGSKNFGLRYPEVERWCTKKKKVAQSDDVLISIRAPVGDINRAPEKCIIGRGLTALRISRSHRIRGSVSFGKMCSQPKQTAR